MALALKEVLTEEIALEGLDGIAINALFLRLVERKGFSFKIDDLSKPYIWNCVLGLKNIDFYQLEQPRIELVSYNRFHYIDPETRHYLETDSIPDDIYHVNVIMEEGVLGSCADYDTRKNITDEVLAGKPLLKQAMETYGNSLVIVATQETRLRTLLGPENDQNVKFKPDIYAILEMIGRSRYNGIASYGKGSLLALNDSTKTMYYFLKKLRRLNIIKKQRLVLVKKPSNVKITCFLYHLERFYVEVGNRQRQEIINMATYLCDKPERMEEVVKTKADLRMFDLFKKVSQMTSRYGKRYFDFIDIPYREKFPDAKPKEYLLKNHYTERKIRHIRLLMPLIDVLQSLIEQDQESDDDDDDDDDEDEDSVPVPSLQFHRVFDQPQLYQTMQLINAAGSKGLSLIQLKKLMSSHALIIRRVIKILSRNGLITSIMEDRGRQKTVMYIAVDYVMENKIHKAVNEKMKQLQTIVMTPLKETIKGSQGVPTKEIPIIKFTNETPNEKKVHEIIEELDKVMENKPCTVSEKSLILRREIMLQKQEESGVNVNVTEVFPEKFLEKRSGKEIRGMKRFGALLTESHVRRANWIVEVVTAIKVVVSYRMLKLLRNREKEMNFTIQMDNKSLKRLVNALCEEGKIRLYKAVITMGEKTKEFLYLCDTTVTPDDETLSRKLEEAKLLNFSVSKEELKNINLKMVAREKLGKEKEKTSTYPTQAMQTIKSHQEYRMRLKTKMPPMNFDRTAGKKYGLLPKMLRIRAVHKYLIYLCYTTHGNELKTEGDQGNSSEDISGLPSETIDTINVHTDQEDTSDDTTKEPVVYVDELSWRRYLPPIPVHSGYPRGWCLVSDCLLIMPVCFFCQIVNVSYQIDGLMETLNHPKKRFYPVINLPFKLTQQLLHAKKYVQSFLHLCGYMAEMGLLSYGRAVLKEKEQTYVYMHQYGSIRDSRSSLSGYNKTTYRDNKPFPMKKFNFLDVNGAEEYWEFLQVVALNSSLGMKSYVQRDLEDEMTYQERSLSVASRTFMPDTVVDDGLIPGDGRGGAGLDSSLFSHTIKNWMYGSVSNSSKYNKYLPKQLGQGIQLVSQREVVDQFNRNRIKGQDRLLLSESTNKPMALKKVRRENLKRNRGGKGQMRTKTTRVTKTHKIVQQLEGKIMKKRSIKFPEKKILKKPAKEKGDEKDKMIYKERNKLRVGFSKKEDSVLLMCWLANLIMNKQASKSSLVPYINIRNYVHDKCGRVSYDKTSIALQRRIKFVLKNPQTETNLLMFYREAMQDEFVLKNYVSKMYTGTSEDLIPDFRSLVDYLLEKFKSLDFKRCTIPENLDVLRRNYTLQYVGKLKTRKVFTDATNKADICRDVLRNILHSAVVLQDKQGRTHEMFKLLSQYPDTLLCQVIKELRTDGLLVINKKNYQQESIAQLQTGMGLRNFKVSQRYLYSFKHRYLSAMFEECASMVNTLCDNYLHSDDQGDDMYTIPFAGKSGDCAALFPLLLNNMLDMRVTMPQELVMVDMEGFYNFPWGRGKGTSHNTKGDRLLQGIKSHSKDKTPDGKSSKKGKGATQDDHLDDFDDDSDDDVVAILNQKAGAERGAGSSQTVTTNLPSDNAGAADASSTVVDLTTVEAQSKGDVPNSEDTNNAVASSNTDEGSIEVLAQSKGDMPDADNAGDISRTIEGSTKVLAQSESNVTDIEDITEPETVRGAEATAENVDDYTVLTTRNCNIIIPTAMPIPEANIKSCVMSAIASRTLISLRRAEDCSFEDIRIFNAQDNFVVNSCVIGVKLKDHTEEDLDEDGSVKVDTQSEDEVNNTGTVHVDSTMESVAANGTEVTDTIEVAMETPPSLDKKKQGISSLLLSKEKIKKILFDLQRMVPFTLDVEEMWRNIAASGVTDDLLTLCKQIYQIIDSYRELGVRSYELKKDCRDKDVWNHALQILLDQSVILKVGVTCTRYVSLRNARPWVIHAYRNIKGRGLHVDEDVHNVAPISQDESTHLGSTSGNANQKPSESSCLIYEEHHDDLIDLPLPERASTSKEANDDSKKMKLSSDSNVDDSVRSGDLTADHETPPDEGESVMGKKRKRSGIGEETETIQQTVEAQDSNKASGEVTDVQLLAQSKRIKLGASNEETDVHQSHETQPIVEINSVNAKFDAKDCVKNTTDEVECAKETTDIVDNVDNVKNTTDNFESAKNSTDNLECAKDSTDNLESAKNSTDNFESVKGTTDNAESVKATTERVESGKDLIENVEIVKDTTDNAEHAKNNTDNLEQGMTENVESAKDITDNFQSANNSTENIESAKDTTKNEGQAEIDTNDTQNPVEEGASTSLRSLRKRKKKDTEEQPVKPIEPVGVSTYDKVRLVIQPWRKPEGGLNKDVLKMMLESVMLFLMMNPGCPVTEVDKRYTPYLQPMVLMNLIDILEDIGCLTKQYMKKQKPSLFSKPTLPQIVCEEEDGCIMLLLPTDDCVLKMGLFGQVAFPNAKWPDTCYPTVIGQKTKTVNS